MVPNLTSFRLSVKTAAVSGIGFVWSNFTVKAFKMGWHIISTSPETLEPVSKVKCEECKEFFIDELEDEKCIC